MRFEFRLSDVSPVVHHVNFLYIVYSFLVSLSIAEKNFVFVLMARLKSRFFRVETDFVCNQCRIIH